MTRQLHIEVFFDFICPWCLIGKRQLQAALQQLQQSDPDVEVNLLWRGVQLIPQLPVEGVAYKAFYLDRLGGAEAVRMRQGQVQQAANAVAVEINFAGIQRMPNTAKAHHLMQGAIKFGRPEQCNQLLEQIFTAYFIQAEDIGDAAVLEKIAAACGFDTAVMNDSLYRSNVPFQSANTAGNGVPYFVFDGRFALAGAHPAATLYKAMLEALATQEQVK